MNNNRREAERWLAQSKHDSRAAALNSREGFYEIACFLCQQSSEKALKAFLYYQGERPVLGHATHLLAGRCQAYVSRFDEVQDICRELDQYYVATRYPNGLPGGIPHDVFTAGNAQQALEGMKAVLTLVSELISEGETE